MSKFSFIKFVVRAIAGFITISSDTRVIEKLEREEKLFIERMKRQHGQ